MQIVHRDISPSNIFISRRGDVKLGDFGIAHAKRRESKTQAGTLKGKYGYMSPEQVVGRPIDARSDLFAVGIVLAEMLMGRRLFTAPDDLDVLLKVRDAHLDRLDKYGADIPRALDRIVRRALKKDPGRAAADRRRAARRAGRLPLLRRQAGGADRPARVHAARCSTPTPTRPRSLLQVGPPRREAARPARRGAAPRAARDRRAAPPAGRRPPPRAAGVPTVSRAAAASARGRAGRRRPPPREPLAGARRRALVGAPVHAGVAPRRQRRHGRRGPACARPDQERRRPLRLGGAQAPAGQRRRDQRHHADAPVLRSGAGRRDGPPALRARRRAEGDLPRRRRARIGQLQRCRRALRRVPGRARDPRPAPISSSRSACCRTTTASWATRWSRSGCCARSTCSACSPSRCATG